MSWVSKKPYIRKGTIAEITSSDKTNQGQPLRLGAGQRPKATRPPRWCRPVHGFSTGQSEWRRGLLRVHMVCATNAKICSTYKRLLPLQLSPEWRPSTYRPRILTSVSVASSPGKRVPFAV